jgi:hypothetical protein
MATIDDLKAELTTIRAAYATLKKDYKLISSQLGSVKAEYDLIKKHLGGWHDWAQTIENVPKRLLAAAKKFLGL